MKTETAIETVPHASIVPLENDNFELSASNPVEMVQCHAQAIEWCKRKLELVKGEAAELLSAFEHAKARKWKSDTLRRHAGLADKRVTFYEKMLAAFNAGYYIVPNFPATAFAIRRDNDPQRRMIGYSYQPPMTEPAQSLPQGDGEYVNPEPAVSAEYEYAPDEANPNHKVRDYYAEDWREMEFPANMARVHIMEAADRAMALKVFDEIGMLPSDKKRHADPLLVGILVCPTSSAHKSDWKRVTFLLAWHIDTRTL